MISYIHKHIPKADPNSDIGKLEENKAHHLTLWKANTYKSADDYIFLILARFRGMRLAARKRFKNNLKTRLETLEQLEHHFRLQAVVSKREKQLAAEFPSDLLRIF